MSDRTKSLKYLEVQSDLYTMQSQEQKLKAEIQGLLEENDLNSKEKLLARMKEENHEILGLERITRETQADIQRLELRLAELDAQGSGGADAGSSFAIS